MTFDILPVKKLNIEDNYGDKIPEPFMKPPFCGAIVGGVKSGKSNVVINLLYRVYNTKIFDKIYFISPNVYNDSVFDTNISIDEDIIKIDKGIEDIDLIVETIVELQKGVDKKDRKHILIVMDDCLGFIKPQRYITNFCTRYRQLKVSMIFLMQALKGIPSVIRANLSWMLYFRSYNKTELKKFFDEYSHVEHIEKFYEQATNEKYSFLFINLRDLKLFKRFDLPALYEI